VGHIAHLVEKRNAYRVLMRKLEGVGERPHSGFYFWQPSSQRPFSVQARYGPFQGLHNMDLPCSQSARSIEPRPAASVYKAAVWSTRNSVLNASLSCSYNGISIDNKISTDRPGSDPVGRSLIHPRSQHDPTGSKPSTTGRSK
jgi:hypothetical protein